MAGKIVRSSKFRHVFGSPYKKDDLFENVPVTSSAADSNFCDANEKFVATIIDAGGGGAFMVMCHDQRGKCNIGGKIVGHKGPVLDIKWNPYNSNMIASASEDCSIKIWVLPDGGIEKGVDIDTPSVAMDGHLRKVTQVLWHPTAENILFSASNDFTIKVWNIGTGQEISCISDHPDTIYTMAFNHDGTKLVTTCKDKNIRIFDSRTGQVEEVAEAHVGSKPTRCLFLGDSGRVLSTGFSKTQERQFILWDSKLTQLKVENIDTSSGVLMPFFDDDLKILYLAGKGDGNIRYYEVTDAAPYIHILSEFKSPEPQRGMGYLPKRAVDVSKCEIARFYKLHSKNYVEPISMVVPRKADVFQEDIYPDTIGDQPALTAEEWLAGKTAEPIKISLKDGFTLTTKSFVAPFLAPAPAPAATINSGDCNTSHALKEYKEGFHRLQSEVAQLTKDLAARDIIIRDLEIECNRLKDVESPI